jgi:hypothetical protein
MYSATMHPGVQEQLCVSLWWARGSHLSLLSQSIQRFCESPDCISTTFSKHLESFTKNLMYSHSNISLAMKYQFKCCLSWKKILHKYQLPILDVQYWFLDNVVFKRGRNQAWRYTSVIPAFKRQENCKFQDILAS